MYDSFCAYQLYDNKKIEHGITILNFRFKPDKKRIILVNVQIMGEHPIAVIKFYDKADRDSKDKFGTLT